MARNIDEYRQFTEEYRNFLYDTLSDLPIDELVSLWNTAVDNDDFTVYRMDEFDERYADVSPLDIARWMYNADVFSPYHDYFWLSEHDGKLQSGDIFGIDCFPYDIYDLIDHIMTTGKDYGCESLLDAINDFTSRHN